MGKLFLFSIFRQKNIAQDAKGLRLSVRSSNLDGLMLYFHYELVVTKQILSSLNMLFKFVKPLQGVPSARELGWVDLILSVPLSSQFCLG